MTPTAIEDTFRTNLVGPALPHYLVGARIPVDGGLETIA